MSRISDSIYYTLLSDGCSNEQAAQTARSFCDPFHADHFEFYSMVPPYEELQKASRKSRMTIKGNPGHPGCFAMYSFR